MICEGDWGTDGLLVMEASCGGSVSVVRYVDGWLLLAFKIYRAKSRIQHALDPGPYSRLRPNTLPPSTVTTAPFTWLLALLAKNTTVPAISSGRPSLLFGFASASAFSPPCNSMRPLAIFDGKKPGAMALHRICRGPSSTARFFVRWMTAALEAEYPKVAFSPKEPTPSPATEAVTMTREGSSIVAFFCSSGANLYPSHQHRRPKKPYNRASTQHHP